MKGPSRVLFDNLCSEFETAWNAVATAAPEDGASGNFLFTRQAMLLVELASTVADQDQPTFKRFSQQLQKREALLFKPLPYKSGSGTRSRHSPGKPRTVPRIAPDGDARSELIEVLFDLLRNGHAHFGHPLYAPLKDGTAFGVVAIGANEGRTIDKLRPNGGRTIHHLACTHQSDGNIVMRVCAGTLYLDVRDASDAAGVWDLDADASKYTDTRRQDVTLTELKAALVASGPWMTMFESSDPAGSQP